MTMHTRAATDEIYSIFNQPLKAETEEDADSFCESDYEDDDAASTGDSTGTGHHSAASSDFGDEETQTFHKSYDDTDYANTTRAESIDGDEGEWTEFNPDRDIPGIEHQDIEHAEVTSHSVGDEEAMSPTVGTPERKGFMPEMPDDYAAPWGTYRDPAVMAQNRLPFMTPIVERTEVSISMTAARNSVYNAKTPSKPRSPAGDLLLESPSGTSTPYRDLTGSTADVPFSPMAFKALAPKMRRREAIIRDSQCNPTDKGIRNTILNSLEPPLAAYTGYNEHVEDSNYASMIHKFVKTHTRRSKGGDDAFDTPILEFPGAERSYIIRRELGAGAYAPVYLAESVDSLESYDSDSDDGETPKIKPPNAYDTPRFHFEAVKVENGPSSAWEFYMIRTAYERLRETVDYRVTDSIVRAHELHVHQRESFLVEDYRGQGTLLDLVNIVRNESLNSNPTAEGGLEEVLAMFFSVELFRTVEALHANGVLHGDIKADNCLVRLDEPSNEPPAKSLSLLDLGTDEPSSDPRESIHYAPSGSHGWQQKGLALIDFGRGIDMQAFSPAVQFLADWEKVTHECNEIREKRPWTYQIDLYGIAGVVHVLLFGKYVESTPVNDENACAGSPRTYRIRESLKRYWDRDLWAGVFDLLLNPGAERWQSIERENGADPSASFLPVVHSMRQVRRGMEEWLLDHAEKKGLALQLRKIEALLADRKKKLEK